MFIVCPSNNRIAILKDWSGDSLTSATHPPPTNTQQQKKTEFNFSLIYYTLSYKFLYSRVYCKYYSVSG